MIGLLGILFGVFHYFRNPQIDSEKREALMKQKMDWQTEGNDRRFKEIIDMSDRQFKNMQENFKDLLLQSNNHVHTVDTKVDALQGIVIGMGQEIVKLGTIIEERFPKK